MLNLDTGSETPPTTDPRAVEALVAYAFAPVHKAALGVAFGLTAGVLTALVTLAHVLLEHGGGLPLGLLGQFFYGYEVSVPGAAIGFFWAFVTGFVAGWFLAFLKNLCTALWVFLVRTKADLTQPFLDHL
ncbi:MAG: hypothetical protein JJE40_04915 [Vicinamibacteria bacterium]|nr:hypothetical protein [Vicinamibacteria bacterium]